MTSVVFQLLSLALSSGCDMVCTNACSELNGDLQSECGSCSAEYACHPGAPGYHIGKLLAPGAELKQMATEESCATASRKLQFLNTTVVQRLNSPLKARQFLEHVADGQPVVLSGFAQQGVASVQETVVEMGQRTFV